MRNVCDTREARQRRWPPKQLERVRRGVYERRRPRATDGEGSRRRGCVSISPGTVILQRLPKLKRLDCFQRVRMVGLAEEENGQRAPCGTNTFLMRHFYDHIYGGSLNVL